MFVTESGPPMVLLHGWPEFWYGWRKNIPVLSENFDVVAPDLRGFGDSEKPGDPPEELLAFLLEHLPPRMHLVIATREDPHLPLARLRAGGQMDELRAADLRFTVSEASEFLEGMMGLSLSAKTSPPWKPVLKAGSLVFNWPRSRCGGERTLPGSSGLSLETTGTSWTI